MQLGLGRHSGPAFGNPENDGECIWSEGAANVTSDSGHEIELAYRKQKIGVRVSVGWADEQDSCCNKSSAEIAPGANGRAFTHLLFPSTSSSSLPPNTAHPIPPCLPSLVMLTRHLLPRACRPSLLQQSIKPCSKCITTDIDASTRSTEAAFAQHLRDAAAGDIASAGDGQSSQPRRRRRRKGGPPRDPVVDSYLAFEHMKKTTAPFGSHFMPGYQPHTLLSNPPSPSAITLELLLASQAHLGHSTSLWNPANARYIFGIRSGIHIISLDITAQHLRRACKIVSSVAERGGLILFVGTRPGFARCVVRAAELAAPAYHLFDRWTPGGITNGQQILGRGQLQTLDEHDNPVAGFEEQLRDFRAVRPDLVVCLNPLECRVLLRECAIATIPTIGVIDTDADPTSVTYPIPANDDSIRCVQVIAGTLGRAGQEGQMRRRERASRGEITYPPAEDLRVPENFDHESWKERQAAKPGSISGGASASPEQAIAAPTPETDESAISARLLSSPSLSTTPAPSGEDSDVEVDRDSPAGSFIAHLRSVLTQEELGALQSGAETSPAVLSRIRSKLSAEDYGTLLSALQSAGEAQEGGGDGRDGSFGYGDRDGKDLEGGPSQVR